VSTAVRIALEIADFPAYQFDDRPRSSTGNQRPDV